MGIMRTNAIRSGITSPEGVNQKSMFPSMKPGR